MSKIVLILGAVFMVAHASDDDKQPKISFESVPIDMWRLIAAQAVHAQPADRYGVFQFSADLTKLSMANRGMRGLISDENSTNLFIEVAQKHTGFFEGQILGLLKTKGAVLLIEKLKKEIKNSDQRLVDLVKAHIAYSESEKQTLVYSHLPSLRAMHDALLPLKNVGMSIAPQIACDGDEVDPAAMLSAPVVLTSDDLIYWLSNKQKDMMLRTLRLKRRGETFDVLSERSGLACKHNFNSCCNNISNFCLKSKEGKPHSLLFGRQGQEVGFGLKPLFNCDTKSVTRAFRTRSVGNCTIEQLKIINALAYQDYIFAHLLAPCKDAPDKNMNILFRLNLNDCKNDPRVSANTMVGWAKMIGTWRDIDNEKDVSCMTVDQSGRLLIGSVKGPKFSYQIDEDKDTVNNQ